MAQRQLRKRTPAQPQPGTSKPPSFVPPVPKTVQETGLNLASLTDLAIKIMYFEGNITG
jgi:hypothetical protein